MAVLITEMPILIKSIRGLCEVQNAIKTFDEGIDMRIRKLVHIQRDEKMTVTIVILTGLQTDRFSIIIYWNYMYKDVLLCNVCMEHDQIIREHIEFTMIPPKELFTFFEKCSSISKHISYIEVKINNETFILPITDIGYRFLLMDNLKWIIPAGAIAIALAIKLIF